MVAAHVNALRSVLATATSELDPGIAIECKHFFSGAAAYANGRIFMTLTSVGFALKLPPEAQAELTFLGGRALRYFPQGPIKKDYLIVPDGIARDADALAAWVIKSVLFSQAVPGPHASTKARRRSAK